MRLPKLLERLVLGSVIIVLIVPLPGNAATAKHKLVCTKKPKPGFARCEASLLTDASGHPLVSASPRGYSPADFHGAYQIGATAGRATTVAIVVAYDATNIKSDLDVFDRTFGLAAFPSCSSSAQTACFAKYDQRGGQAYPKVDASWELETSLDVETVHGMCQNCRIDLVEAASTGMNDLGAAAAEGAALGARVESNSYGGSEFAGETAYDNDYHHSGVIVTASSGDNGYGTSYPAASPFVVAVGGTSLHWNGSSLTSEAAWTGAGSGCSSYEPKPSWQHDSGCASRTIADLAAAADPANGAAIYDSKPSSGRSGWFVVGGTSLAAPLVAGMYGVSGSSGVGASYAAAGSLRDITTGKNGSCRNYLCAARVGYDGPTGLGVAHGRLP